MWQNRSVGSEVARDDTVADANDRVLSGQSDFDFGRIPFVRPTPEVSHTFRLENQTDKPLKLVKTSSSCGCTNPRVAKDLIVPGETVDVEVELSFAEPSKRNESAWLIFESGMTHRLQISGAAVTTSRFWVAQQAVPLDATRHEELTLVVLDQIGKLTPANPTIEVPSNVAAHFGGWNLVHDSDTLEGRPSRWHGKLTLMSDGSIPFRSKAKVTAMDTIAAVDLTGWPWDN
jgi:hypothetical protein